MPPPPRASVRSNLRHHACGRVWKRRGLIRPDRASVTIETPLLSFIERVAQQLRFSGSRTHIHLLARCSLGVLSYGAFRVFTTSSCRRGLLLAPATETISVSTISVNLVIVCESTIMILRSCIPSHIQSSHQSPWKEYRVETKVIILYI